MKNIFGEYVLGELFSKGLVKGLCISLNKHSAMIRRIDGKDFFVKPDAQIIPTDNLSQRELKFIQEYKETHPDLEEIRMQVRV